MRLRVAVLLLSLSIPLGFPVEAGGKWERVVHLRGRMVVALLSKGDALFTATAEAGVFLSKDQGTSWQPVNAGLPPTAVIRCLAARGAKLFLGTSGHGVFVSENNGGWWTAANAGFPDRTEAWCMVNAEAGLLVGTGAGAYLIGDQAARWEPANTGLPPDTRVYALASDGSDLVAGTDRGAFLSVGGRPWTPFAGDLPPQARIKCLAAFGPVLYAGTEEHGLFQANVDDARWEPAGKGIPASAIDCLAAVDGGLLAGTGGGTTFHIGDLSKDQVAWKYHGPGVFLSKDAGRSWKAVNPGLRRAPAYPGLGKRIDMWIERLVVCGPHLFAGTEDGEIWRLPLSELPKK